MQVFVDCLAVTSGLVAVMHFLVPQSFLDWADQALKQALQWLQDNRYARFRERLAQGEYDRRMMQIGSILILLNGVLSCTFKIAVTPISAENVPAFFVIQSLIFIFSMAAFYRFGIPLIRWAFKGQQFWLTLMKTAFALVLASAAGLAVFALGALSMERAQQPSIPVMSHIDFIYYVGITFGFPYGALFLLVSLAMVAMAGFIANGVVSIVLIFYLYFVVFMWAAWALVTTAAFILNRSLQRKGLAVFVASVSTFLSALMRFHSH